MQKKVFLFFLLVNMTLHGDNFSHSNIQLLYGTNFDRLIGEESIPNGSMATATFENVSQWGALNSFLFIDATSADYSSGENSSIYGEWAPKISLSRLTNSTLEFGPIKDIFIASEVNRGKEFYAYNLGLGLSLDIPSFIFFDLNIFRRDDNYNLPTYQTTIVWLSKFDLFSLPLSFDGFLDYYGTDYGTEIITQPRLLIDGSYFSNSMQNLQIGIELYCYRSSSTSWRSEVNEVVPQFMVKWNLH